MGTKKFLWLTCAVLMLLPSWGEATEAQRRTKVRGGRGRAARSAPVQTEAAPGETPAPQSATPTETSAVPPPSPYGSAPSEEASEAPQTSPAPRASSSASASSSSENGEEAAGEDLSEVRESMTSLMDDLVNARSRVAVLGRQLFRTKLRVRIHNKTGHDAPLARLEVALDGAAIFRGDGSTLSDDEKQVFEGFASPGPHSLSIIAENRARTNDAYRYDVRDTYRIEVVQGKLNEATIILDGSADIAEDFPDDGEGEYDVRTKVRVATRDLHTL